MQDSCRLLQKRSSNAKRIVGRRARDRRAARAQVRPGAPARRGSGRPRALRGTRVGLGRTVVSETVVWNLAAILV